MRRTCRESWELSSSKQISSPRWWIQLPWFPAGTSPYTTRLQGIMVVLFIKTNIQSKTMNTTTVAPRYNEPRYNEDPVITNNIWKPGRITVKYVETNPAITNPAITNRFWRSQRTIYPTITNIFVLSLAVSKNDMMVQMGDKPNKTPIGQDRENLTFEALLYLNVAVHVRVCFAWCISHCSAWFTLVTPL